MLRWADLEAPVSSRDLRVDLPIALRRATSRLVLVGPFDGAPVLEVIMQSDQREQLVPLAEFQHKDPISVVPYEQRFEYALAWCRYWLEQFLEKPLEEATDREIMELPLEILERVFRVYALALN